ncbi:hypothetical protein C9374_002941 [Naegleria lovaniensis]|uniref:ADP-ribosylhydrolase ARH3 n=1 Tax=Naegleria lovaniensis TaxID=51637 RepID=A0AA88GN88_NAELO|nr:uncharacterized protein C9374_002941 [Naegleria lovaniensis]KAG2385792.1 hypothetical protein C9374_002941 [Naegleria lovaniensis]
MGNAQSSGKLLFATREQAIEACFSSSKQAVEVIKSNKYASYALSGVSILGDDEQIKSERELVQQKLRNKLLDPKEDRALGCILGNAIGDALGAPLEFSPVRYNVLELTGLDHAEIWQKSNYNRFGLKPGQWTDDFSMALCIADSLLVKQDFNALDLRTRFVNWWYLGYCNAFGFSADLSDRQRSSVGLGGNISMSMTEFLEDPTIEFTESGDKNTSGNGSVMRHSPVPVMYHDDRNKAMAVASAQSKTTHQGEEAAELCRLLAFITVNAINRADSKKDVLEDLSEFQTDLYSVQCLCKSMKEEKHESNAHLNVDDRNWNWKDPDFEFCRTRAKQQPGYVGSYAMDAVAMALHCVYTTDNFVDAMLKSANMRGDSDSYTAVTGSLCGAIYGSSSIPLSWIDVLQQFDRNGDIALKAYKLYHKQFNL